MILLRFEVPTNEETVPGITTIDGRAISSEYIAKGIMSQELNRGNGSVVCISAGWSITAALVRPGKIVVEALNYK